MINDESEKNIKKNGKTRRVVDGSYQNKRVAKCLLLPTWVSLYRP